MPQLRRLAIATENPAKLAAFYQNVFDLVPIGEEEGTLFLSDGTFNLALMPLVEGRDRGLSSIGFDTARIESLKKKLASTGGIDASLLECVPKAGIECETRDPDGNAIGLCKRAFDVAYQQTPVPIRHIALYTSDPQRLANYYCRVLDMKEVDRTDRSSIFVSDGYLNLALLYQRKEEGQGLNHFGFYVKSNEEMRERAARAGVAPGAKRPDRIPFAEYRVHDLEGNGIDISEKGWKA
ncbi:MAG TPA: VOC family protein [Candidatus Acidoferrales bacterium]|nr:VOC family protein [Candidatus Acidoferrales bacterium]